MGCQKWLCLCAPIFLTYFWRSRYSVVCHLTVIFLIVFKAFYKKPLISWVEKWMKTFFVFRLFADGGRLLAISSIMVVRSMCRKGLFSWRCSFNSNKIKLSFMTSIALLYKHCTSWGQKVSEHSGGHPCWKIIPIFFSRFFWLNGRERAIWWRYNVPHYYYSFYCPNSFMIETLLLQHSALKFELSVISNVLGLSGSMITSKDTKSVHF